MFCSSTDCNRPFAGPVAFCPFCGQKQVVVADAVVKTASKKIVSQPAPAVITPPIPPAPPQVPAAAAVPPSLSTSPEPFRRTAHTRPTPPSPPSAQPAATQLPAGVAGWSWGAFLLNVIWAIGNRTWIGLLALIPYVGFIMAIILGIKGREWAWKNNQWNGIDHFNRVQRKWSLWGAWIYIILIALAVGLPAYEDYQKRAADNVDSQTVSKQPTPVAAQVPETDAAEVSAQLQRADAAFNNGDFATALTELRPLANQGDVAAQNRLGFMYSNGKGVTQDDTQAVSWYRKAADQGDASAQINLGSMYQNGKGVQQDETQAAIWYRKAADQGDAGGQNKLGLMFAMGKGVSQDDTQAVSWFRRAAEQGVVDAQYNLGWMYHTGRGVPQDDKQAEGWLKKAADQGQVPAKNLLDEIASNATNNTANNTENGETANSADASAQLQRGTYAYRNGDFTTALAEWRPLAEQGNATAQSNLGVMYRDGRGVPQNDVQARFWLRKAADQGHAYARQLLGQIGGSVADTTIDTRSQRDGSTLMQQCIINSRTLTTQAGSRVALSESEATRYCNCAQQQSGTLASGIPAPVGNRCLNQL